MNIFIYEARNKINNKKYYGQTIDLETRKVTHLRESNSKKLCHIYFKRAIKKYGIDGFEWKIIAKTNDQDEADRLETYYIDNSGDYNTAAGGIGGLIKLSKKQEKERINKILKTKSKWTADYKNTVYAFTQTDKFKAQASVRNTGFGNYWYGKEGYWSGKKNPEHSKRMKGRTHIVTEEVKRRLSEKRKEQIREGKIKLPDKVYYTLFNSVLNETKRMSHGEWIKAGIDLQYIQKTGCIAGNKKIRKSKGWQFVKKD